MALAAPPTRKRSPSPLRSPPPRECPQVLPEDDERRQQHRRLEKDRLLPSEARCREKRVEDPDEIGGPDAGGVEQVHVRDAPDEAAGALDEELPSWPQDDGRGQEKENKRAAEPLRDQRGEEPALAERPRHDDAGERPGHRP